MQYIGTTADNIPTAIPAMRRPVMSMGIVAAPACRAHPKVEIHPPRKTVFLRPRRSASHDIDKAPITAPPLNEDTMPPVVDGPGEEEGKEIN